MFPFGKRKPDLTALAVARIAALSSRGNRRREERHPTDAPAVVSLPDGLNWWDCRVLDVSRSGLRIRCEHAFAVGEQLYLVLPGGSAVVGEARYSRPVEQGFDTGVWIQTHTTPAM